jgi:plastocyanin
MIQELWTQFLEFTSKLVVPDWGSLVALIPILLLILGVLYLVWIVIRFGNAGPTRRGKRRLPPRTPPGIHMPGPSFAPILGAIGTFFLGFGIVAGGLWLLVGALILVVTLLYWGRESLRDYDTVSAHAGQAVVVGALPAPEGTVPAGVHIPAPSFRPLLVAFAMTVLVMGLVLGGWALVLGFIAIVLTGLGWLWDAGKEYRATEAADVTGHLDAGGSPPWPKATFAALGVLVVAALVLSSGFLPNSGGDAVPSGPVASAPAGGGAPPPASEAPKPDADVVLTAKGTQWVETTLTLPAGKAFTLALDNQDPLPHDVQLKDAGGAVVYHSAVVEGPKVAVLDVDSLPAGQYSYICTIHTNMTGTATAQ